MPRIMPRACVLSSYTEGTSRMDDWRIPLGLLPLVLGFALLGLGSEVDNEVLRSLGLGGLVWGSLVLAFGTRSRD